MITLRVSFPYVLKWQWYESREGNHTQREGRVNRTVKPLMYSFTFHIYSNFIALVTFLSTILSFRNSLINLNARFIDIERSALNRRRHLEVKRKILILVLMEKNNFWRPSPCDVTNDHVKDEFLEAVYDANRPIISDDSIFLWV